MSLRISTSADYARGISVHTPDWLSFDHVKRYRYAQEPYYQESLFLALQILRNPDALHRHTYVLIKPDGFPTRSLTKLLPELEGLGYEVIASHRVRFCRFLIRELWRYEYNVARVQRYELLDLFLPAGESLLLLLKDQTGSGRAAGRLSEAKGASDPQKRSATSIRTRIGACNGTLNFIHTPDTAIDLVRELGVIFPAHRLREIYDQISTDEVGTVKSHLALGESIEQTYPHHPLTLGGVVDRFGDAFGAAIRRNERDLRSNTFPTIEKLIRSYPLRLWDKVTIANEFIDFRVPLMPASLDFEIAVAEA